MIQSFFHRFLLRRHFWRHATFSEVAELYTARLLRMTGNAMIATFVGIYLLRNGYPLYFIAGYYAAYYLFKALLALPCAMYVARFGPKHGTLAANLIGVPALITFSFLDNLGLVALVIFSLCQGISMVLYGLSYMVNFSKVKSTQYAGKEISYMHIIDKVAAGISPLAGGLVAWLISPEVTIWIASALLLFAAVPLLRTAEPVKVHQKLSFRGFPWQQTWRSMRAQVATGIDTAAVLVIWPLFLATVVFSQSSNAVYAQIGALSAVSVFVAFIAARSYGVMIDHKKGGELLRYSTIVKSLTHFVRPFVVTPLSAVLTNVLNEAAAAGYSMSFMRGMFDTADRSGHRILYLLMMELALNLGGFIISLVLFVALIAMVSSHAALSVTFMVTGVATLCIMSARFPLYRRGV